MQFVAGFAPRENYGPGFISFEDCQVAYRNRYGGAYRLFGLACILALTSCALIERADRLSIGLDVSTGVPGLPEVRFGLDIEDSRYETLPIPPSFDRLSDLDYELLDYQQDKREAGLSESED